MIIGYLINGNTLPGIALDKVFTEKEKFNPESAVLKKCIQTLNAGDVLYIETLDMLGQSFVSLKSTLDTLLEKGVVVNFHKESIEFSQDKPEGNTALRILSEAVAFEKRSAKKKLNGLKNNIGRPKIKFSSRKIDKAITDISCGKPKATIAQELNISRPTLNRLINNREKELRLLSGEKV